MSHTMNESWHIWNGAWRSFGWINESWHTLSISHVTHGMGMIEDMCHGTVTETHTETETTRLLYVAWLFRESRTSTRIHTHTRTHAHIRYYLGVHRPPGTVIKLGFHHPRKKERKKSWNDYFISVVTAWFDHLQVRALQQRGQDCPKKGVPIPPPRRGFNPTTTFASCQLTRLGRQATLQHSIRNSWLSKEFRQSPAMTCDVHTKPTVSK